MTGSKVRLNSYRAWIPFSTLALGHQLSVALHVSLAWSDKALGRPD